MSNLREVTSGAPVAADLPPILILGDHLGYDDGVVHGVTMYFLNVLPALKRAGVRFTLCFLRDPHPAAQEFISEGIEPVFLSAARFDPFVVDQVAALARRHGCRIIHAAGFKGTLVARLAAHRISARVIVHLHDLLMPGLPLRVLNAWAARADDHAICLSSAARPVAERGYHVRPERIRVIYNGIALHRLQQGSAEGRARLRDEWGAGATRPVLGMVGRLFAIKGPQAMLRIMARVVAARPEALLVMVGDGPERAACEALCSKLGLQRNVLFLGQRGDIPQLMAAFDLVVVPSLLEGLGLAAIEALAASRPVVCFGVGGMPEVVTDGEDGYVVAPGDEAAFARAAEKLLDDPACLARFGAQAAISAARFSVERHVARLLECYREVAA